MNAYELADKLQELDAKLHLIVLFKSAVMLRQQANRIAELSKNVDELEEELLKAPQIKELSDEEIEEVMYKCDWAYDPVAFARAILKKASEK
jgi:hypothetical protein